MRDSNKAARARELGELWLKARLGPVADALFKIDLDEPTAEQMEQLLNVLRRASRSTSLAWLAGLLGLWPCDDAFDAPLACGILLDEVFRIGTVAELRNLMAAAKAGYVLGSTTQKIMIASVEIANFDAYRTRLKIAKNTNSKRAAKKNMAKKCPHADARNYYLGRLRRGEGPDAAIDETSLHFSRSKRTMQRWRTEWQEWMAAQSQ